LEAAGFEVLYARDIAQIKTLRKSVVINPSNILETEFREGHDLLKYQYLVTVRDVGSNGTVSATTKSNALSPDAVWGGVLMDHASRVIYAQIVTGGPIGTATVKFSADAMKSWSLPVLTASTVQFAGMHQQYLNAPVTGTGPVLSLPAGTYTTGDRYAATFTRKLHASDATAMAMGEFLKIASKVLYHYRITPVEQSDENESGISTGNQMQFRLETTINLSTARQPNLVTVTETAVNYPETT
jgi:hypothetical protein